MEVVFTNNFMKKLLTLFLISNCVFLFAQLDSLQKKILDHQLKYYNERCQLDSIRAVADSKIENRYFMPFVAPHDYYIPFENELRAIFGKHNIIYSGIAYHSDIPLHYSGSECYNDEMNRFTISKFGREFLENLVKESVKKYIDNPDNLPLQKLIPTPFGKDRIDLKYKRINPLIFRKPNIKNKYSTHQYIELLIDVNGNVKDFRDLELNFINDEVAKKKFLKDFKLFLKKQKLEPVTYYDFEVIAWRPIEVDIIY